MSALDTFNSAGSDLGNVAGTYQGINRGTPAGYLGAGSNLATLLGRTGLGGDYSGALSHYGGEAGSLAGLIQGIQSGGWGGDTEAAISAARLGSQAGVLPSALGQYAGYAAIPLSLYNFVNNYQSGATGSDAANGAEAGASIGSAFAPGVGTALGAVIGGAAGAISSAFGPGEEDPENANWNQYAAEYDQNPQVQNYISPSQAYQNLAGVMDAKDNAPGHSEPIEQVFGRMGEQNLMDQMTNYVNQEYGSGAIKPGESISQQWNSTIYPWLESKGATIDPNQNTVKGSPEGGALAGDLQSLVGDWENGQLTPSSQVGVDGQTIGGLNSYAGPSPLGLAQHPLTETTIQYSGKTPQVLSSQLVPQAAARGGVMSKKRNAQDVISGPSFSDRAPQEFDGGGYVNYSSYDSAQSDPYSQIDYSGSGNPYSGLSSIDYGVGNTNPYGGIDQTGLGTGFDNYASGDPSGSTGESGSQGNSSWLSSLLSGLGGSGGSGSSNSGLGSQLGQLVKNYAWLLPLIGAATGATTPKQATPPGQPSGFSTTPSHPYSTPNYQRQATKFPSGTDWYTYGEHPEQQFFSNNQLPYVSGFSPAEQAPASTGPQPVMAGGGALDFASGSGDHFVEGPGDGTSDDIPAKLSDGEYVMDAGTVSMLGNGSNEAGARKLDMLRENLRRHAGKSLTKGKQFMKAKAPEQYLPRAGQGPRGEQE